MGVAGRIRGAGGEAGVSGLYCESAYPRIRAKAIKNRDRNERRHIFIRCPYWKYQCTIALRQMGYILYDGVCIYIAV